MSPPAPPRSRYERAALVTSLVSVAVAAVLAWALLAKPWSGALDEDSWLWPAVSGGLVLALVLAWLSCVSLGIVFGFITLSLPAHPRRRAYAAVLASVLSLVAVPAVGLHEFLEWAGPHHPSDDELIARYEQHEDEFAAVAKAIRTRRPLTRADLSALGAEGVDAVNPQEFYVRVSSWGIVPSGSAKGYYYSETPPQPLVDDLHSGAAGDGYTFRHVSGPWYLYFELW